AALGVFVLWLTFFITPFHYTDCFSVRQIGYGAILERIWRLLERLAAHGFGYTKAIKEEQC
ncbi:hypothetical protein, partial [Ruthenibacterium lactatiformans]|uniref:hypothetical protein n=1 Tax=Ruthenibacterium lactatiformans TaxID=1550024 RepID=UPI0019677489